MNYLKAFGVSIRVLLFCKKIDENEKGHGNIVLSKEEYDNLCGIEIRHWDRDNYRGFSAIALRIIRSTRRLFDCEI